MRRPVLLGAGKAAPAHEKTLSELMALAADTDGSAVTSLLILKPAADAAQLPGSGMTLALWELLATLGAADLTAARVVEPHLDAQAILAQAALLSSEAGVQGVDFHAGTWGVYAAEGPGLALQAAEHDGAWQLSGRKPWCSLADQLDYAVVTAHTGNGNRRAFAVDLRDSGVQVAPAPWISRGLAAVDSRAVDFDAVPAVPVGRDNWYLERDGFAWGGIGVAAVWYGGAVAVARRLFQASRERTPDQIAQALIGAADLSLQAAGRMLASAAADVDAGRAAGEQGAVLAQRVRGVVADSVERVLAAAAHGLGPGPLTAEEEHARRIADLQVYVRQHHAERDHASLGKLLLAREEEPW
ncbi:MAG: Acyl-CoA dehydrogenase/oxidase domain protein [Arthrobacter koreensis]|uniref:acyl-CoA dehydrogenase family protein n=1 Tax=Arthrobacter koreensis TaxID=199136 RepID=UPI0024093990|nr:acyl-CoA dehydrogenase family protein [Arthrobacter koreensis]MDF2496633.1 Acyl-CoA dehydrogenase/oxidase domain protein [Arthrobacter koreensis]